MGPVPFPLLYWRALPLTLVESYERGFQMKEKISGARLEAIISTWLSEFGYSGMIARLIALAAFVELDPIAAKLYRGHLDAYRDAAPTV